MAMSYNSVTLCCHSSSASAPAVDTLISAQNALQLPLWADQLGQTISAAQTVQVGLACSVAYCVGAAGA